MALGSGAVVLKLVPGLAEVVYVTPVIGSTAVPVATVPVGSTLRANRTGLCNPTSTPKSWLLFNWTSAIITWMTTCGGCESIRSMIRLISPNHCGVALISSVLLTGSGTITMFRWTDW